MRQPTFTNRAVVALLASVVVGLTFGNSEPATVRITTWNLEWFPNGSAHDAMPEVQAQRIAAAADYEACARLGEAIAPGIYHVAICSAFKEPFQSGLAKQQVAIYDLGKGESIPVREKTRGRGKTRSER